MTNMLKISGNFQKNGLLILFSGRPAAGKTTIALKLVDLLEIKFLRKVHLIEFDCWRQNHFKKNAFDRKLLPQMLKKLNLEIKEYLQKKDIIIVESGATTANSEYRSILTKNIPKVLDIRINCSFLKAFQRDIIRSLAGQYPRIRFLYLQAFFRNIFLREKIYLAGFNKQLEDVNGIVVSTQEYSSSEVAEIILKQIIK